MHSHSHSHTHAYTDKIKRREYAKKALKAKQQKMFVGRKQVKQKKQQEKAMSTST